MNLSQSQHQRIHARFNRRRNAIVASWIHILAPDSAPDDTLRTPIEELVDRVVNLVLAPTFDEAAAQAIGVALIDLPIVPPEALGETQAVLGRGLLDGLPESLVSKLGPRLGLVLGAIADGYFAHKRAASEARHDEVRQALVNERAELVATAQHSAAMFRSMFEDAAVGMAIVAPDGRLLRANPALCEMLGYTEAELRLLNVAAITHPDDLAEDVANIARLLRGDGTTFQMEKRYLHRQGQIVWAFLSVSLVLDDRRQPLHFVSQVQNITARKREERQNAIFARLSHDLSEAEHAEAAARLIAAAADQLLGWDAFSLVLHESDSDRAHVVLNIDLIDGQRVDVPRLGGLHGPSPLARRVMAEGPLLLLPEVPSAHLQNAIPFGDTERPSASLMYVPIPGSGGAMGVLSIQSYTPQAYTPADLDLLYALANTCGGALARIRATTRLQRSEARYRAVVEQQTELLCRSLPDGTLTFVNEAYCRFFGKRADQLIGANYQTLIPSEKHNRIARYIAGLTPDHPLVTYEYQEQAADGEGRWLQWTDRGIFDEQGQLIEVQSVGRDVTERVQAEAQLRNSEAANRALLEALPDVLYHLRRDGVILNIRSSDKSPTRPFGLYDAVGKRLHDVLPLDLADLAIHGIEQTFRARSVQTFEYSVSVSGDVYHREARVAICGDDEVLALIRDITVRKRAEEALRRSEAANRALLNTIPDMIFRLDRNGRFLEYQGQPHLTIVPPQEFVGKTQDEVLPPAVARQANECLRRALTSDAPQMFEYEMAVNGYTGIFEARMVRYGDDEVLSIVREISARRAVEAARIQAHKLESLGNLSAGIAHEFNNLLMVILGNSELAQLDLPPDTSARGNIAQIELAARQAAQLTGQMLAYAGKERVATQPLAIPQLLDELRSTIGKRVPPEITLRYDLPPDMPHIAGDPAQLGQVVLHLLANAVDALGNTPGMITIGGGTMDVREIERDAIAPQHHVPAGHYVFIDVADTGHGMDAETRSRMFDPFFTTKASGSGLSLAAVLGIVHSHDGTIRVTSAPDRGTTVRVLLPAISTLPDSASDRARSTGASGNSMVLVVDDDPRVRRLTTRLLARLQYAGVEADGGAAAVKLFGAAPDMFNVVLLDLTMPEMNGVATFHALRSIRPDACIVLMSGYGEQHAAAELMHYGLAGFLQKPFTSEELKAALDGLLVVR